MNPCHYCSCLPSIQQIISCSKCQFSYCLKCVRRHIQTQPSTISLSSIKHEHSQSAWQCFACNKTCLCRQCKMNMNQIQRIIFNKKQQPLKYQKNYEEYKQKIECLEIFGKNNKFQQLSLFQKEYYVGKVMLYAKQGSVKGNGKNNINEIVGNKKKINEGNVINMNGSNVMVIQESEENQNVENNVYSNNKNNKHINNKIIQQPSTKHPTNQTQQQHCLLASSLVNPPTLSPPIIIDIDQQDQQQEQQKYQIIKPQQQQEQNIQHDHKMQNQHNQSKHQNNIFVDVNANENNPNTVNHVNNPENSNQINC